MTKILLSIGECMIELSPTKGDQWCMGVAGDTLNTAWYAQILLSQDWKTEYFTRLGHDIFSNKILAFLTENGIGTKHAYLDEHCIPGMYAIDLKDGERSFTYWRTASAARHLADNEKSLKRAIESADAIYFSGITLAILKPDRRAFLIDEIGRARASGKLTVFDDNLRPELWENQKTMETITFQAAAVSEIALPSFDDDREYFGVLTLEECAQRYLSAGTGEVVVKNSGGPILVACSSGHQILAEHSPVNPVDTTGAGDSFNGAYLAARLAGADPSTAARNAHAISAQVIGFRGALVNLEQLVLP